MNNNSELSHALHGVQYSYPEAEPFLIRAFGRNFGNYESHDDIVGAATSMLSMMLQDDPTLYDDVHYDLYYHL